MNVRTRKAVGSVGIVVFLIAYVAIVSTIGDHIPKVWWAQLPYYGLAGIGWGLPIIPLITWMNREP
jgi:hypothetical protein